MGRAQQKRQHQTNYYKVLSQQGYTVQLLHGNFGGIKIWQIANFFCG